MEKYNNLRSDRVIDAIQEYIDVNGLKAYEPLPSERKLSELWQVSRGTIRDAIARMCREGTLYTVQGKGSFVADTNRELLREEHLKRVEEYLEMAVKEAWQAGISKEEVREMLELLFEEA